ncbi:MAG: glutamate 5-kinase [Verrucomicrobiales bacterium]|nr:glutamate 5-kinase [Verrucomicrobiales bacterium]
MAAPLRIVLKFGTGILTQTEAPALDPIQLRKLAEAVALLKQAGCQVVVVSSGAVAAGLHPLGLDQRPSDTVTLQACAAVGQTDLMHRYESLLREHGCHVAQLLLTHDDLESPERAARVRSTLDRLLSFPTVVPIINENDSVAVEELRFGDNDKLSAKVAMLWQADRLVLLTSVPGLLDDADQLIPEVPNVAAVLHHARQGDKGSLSVGGMSSKLQAVQAAVESGVECLIASGRTPEQLPALLLQNQGLGTRFPTATASRA